MNHQRICQRLPENGPENRRMIGWLDRDFQIVSAHCKAGPVRAEITNAILDCSVVKICGCSSIVREHCNRKPLHSSASPEKGAGQAMGLANRICEGELETTGEGAGADGAGETGGLSNTFFKESTSS